MQGVSGQNLEQLGRALLEEPPPAMQAPVARGALLQPWLDHTGRPNRELFEALARRAISAVVRSPGG